MTFTFETAGNNTFLVYQIQPEDTLDTMTLGMITKNKIPGIAPAIYTRVNRDDFLKYNVTAKISARKFFSGVVSRNRLLRFFSGITATLSAAEEYMIEPDSLVLDMDYIYVDVASCQGELICLPVMNGAGKTDIGLFFKNIMFGSQFDQSENCDYVAKIMNYLNSCPGFSAEEFGRLTEELQRQSASMRPGATDVPVHKVKIPMEEQSRGGVCQPGTAAVEKQPQIVVPAVEPPKRAQEPRQVSTSPSDVPGSNMGFEVPGTMSAGESSAPSKEKTQEKGMSMFYLLQHYNKENAELYKMQKNARKKAGNREGGKRQKEQKTESGFSVPGQQATLPQEAEKRQQSPGALSREAENLQQNQSAPVSENFGETVILNENAYGEDTVVLDYGRASKLKPYLLRCSNNEKIVLDKALYRIGKERSYVDYCISDNATVSRSHADIVCRDGQFYIVDNNSTNHTYINGEIIPSNQEIHLVHGTKIRLSDEEFEFRTF